MAGSEDRTLSPGNRGVVGHLGTAVTDVMLSLSEAIRRTSRSEPRGFPGSEREGTKSTVG